MKNSASLEQTRLGQLRASNLGQNKPGLPTTAKGLKLPPARRRKIAKPFGLLEEHGTKSEVFSVNFEYFNPAANEVFLAGSFNDWQWASTPMTKRRGGKWSRELMLKPGRYEYRLIVDGRWQDDPMAAQSVSNPFGSLNSVIEVKALES